MHHEAGHVRLWQYGLKHGVDKSIPVFAAEQPRYDRFHGYVGPAYFLVKFQRQDIGPRERAVRSLPQCLKVNAVRPVTARVNCTCIAFVADIELARPYERFPRNQWRCNRLLGKAAGEQAKIIASINLGSGRTRASQ